MKKLLLFLSVAMMALAVHAQTPRGAQNAKAPNRVNLTKYQRSIGNFDEDEAVLEPFYHEQLTHITTVAEKWKKDLVKDYAGSKLVKIRFHISSDAEVKRVFICPTIDDIQAGEEYSQPLAGKALKGWNEVTLTTPYEFAIDGKTDYMVGYEYVQEKDVKVMTQDTRSDIRLMYVKVSDDDWAEAPLCLALTGVMEYEKLDKTHIVLTKATLDKGFYKLGDDLTCEIGMRNFGEETPKEYKVDFYLDNSLLLSKDNPVQIEDNVKTENVTMKLPADLSKGKHIFLAKIASVNGEPPAKDYTKTADIYIYRDTVPRQKYLIEKTTSIACSNCPAADDFIDLFTKMYGNTAVAAAHGQNSDKVIDPYMTGNFREWRATMQLSGYPLVIFNRKMMGGSIGQVVIDGTEEYAKYYAQQMDASPVFVTVNISAKHTYATSTLDITVSGKAVENLEQIYGKDALLNVYLTEDGLVYKQLQSDHKYKEDYVHNHVLRKFVTDFNGSPINWNDDRTTYENSYTVTIPGDWNVRNMNVVAFIARAVNPAGGNVLSELEVCNAESLKIQEDPDSIRGVTALPADEDATRYNLAGQKVAADFRGIVIRNGKKIVR